MIEGLETLSFKDIKPDDKIIIVNRITERIYSDTVTSTSIGHIGIKFLYTSSHGADAFKHLDVYTDDKKTRTIFLLENIKIEKIR